MEHIRSTLATTAAAVLGLVVAAHVLHPGNFEEQQRPAKRPDAVAMAPAPATVWTDPPAASRGVATPTAVAGADASSAPRATVAPPLEAMMTPALPQEMTAPRARARKAIRAARSGDGSAVRRVARSRQGAPVRVAAATSPDPATSAEAGKPAGSRIDPIGGLIRGLGLDLGS